MKRFVRITWPVFAVVLFAACGETDSTTPDAEVVPCGIRVCSADEYDDGDSSYSDPEALGKADAVDRVMTALGEGTADGVLSADDVDLLFDAAGGRVSRDEIETIREVVFGDDLLYEVEDDAFFRIKELALAANVSEIERDYLLAGYRFSSYETPALVREALAQAKLHGAIVYDVNERDNDGEYLWTPYPATTPAKENMTFDYTEITPEKLQADIDDTEVEYNAIVGTEQATTASGEEYEQAKYEVRKGGTGNIFAHYDHVYHPDIYARGSQGQKWANNFAILSDGSVHCLPAARRSYLQDVILTNPHLSRGARMMYNGHLEVREGMVVGIEMSGRLSKLAAKDKANFIDPIPLLEAWGFEMSPNIDVRFGNTRHGVPLRENGVIKAAPAVDDPVTP